MGLCFGWKIVGRGVGVWIDGWEVKTSSRWMLRFLGCIVLPCFWG